MGNKWEEQADSFIRWVFVDRWPEELGEERFGEGLSTDWGNGLSGLGWYE